MKKAIKTTTSSNILAKIHRVNLDLMKKVAYSQKFQSDIRKIRFVFNIEPNGFKNNRDCNLWHRKLVLHADIDSKKKDAFNTLFSFNQEVLKTTTANKLPMNFKDHVRNHILYNTINAPATNHAISFGLNNGYIGVAIYNKPTRDEWKLIKEEVELSISNAKKKSFKFLSKYEYPLADTDLHPSKTFDRDIKIMKLSEKRGKTIYDEEGNYKWRDKDVATEYLPENAKIKDVNKFIPKMRKARSRMKKSSKSS